MRAHSAKSITSNEQIFDTKNYISRTKSSNPNQEDNLVRQVQGTIWSLSPDQLDNDRKCMSFQFCLICHDSGLKFHYFISRVCFNFTTNQQRTFLQLLDWVHTITSSKAPDKHEHSSEAGKTTDYKSCE